MVVLIRLFTKKMKFLNKILTGFLLMMFYLPPALSASPTVWQIATDYVENLRPKVYSSQYCDETGENCFDPAIVDKSNTNEIQGVQTNQGIQTDESDDFGIISCADGQILKNSGGTSWACASDNEGSGGGGNIGGLYGINVETLSGDKTLVSGTDVIYQYLDPDNSNRIVNLPETASLGDRFIVKNTVAFNSTTIKIEIKEGTNTVDLLSAGKVGSYIYDGTNWVAEDGTSGSNIVTNDNQNLSLGYDADGSNRGVAVGYKVDADSFGTSVGYSSEGSMSGAALGAYSRATDYGVAIGHQADTKLKRYSKALGNYSETERVGEFWQNGTTQSMNLGGAGTVQWYGTTSDDTQTELFLQDYTTSRFVLQPNSAVNWRMLITAIDNTTHDVAMYTREGMIKRDGSNNTTLQFMTTDRTNEQDTSWDVDIRSDNANEALILKVTGDATNTVSWHARMDYSEVRF